MDDESLPDSQRLVEYEKSDDIGVPFTEEASDFLSQELEDATDADADDEDGDYKYESDEYENDESIDSSEDVGNMGFNTAIVAHLSISLLTLGLLLWFNRSSMIAVF
jgi:hypothetical protein